MMVLDDSRFGVVIVLNPGWSCEVSEYTDPGALMLSFKEDAGAEEEGAVYYLRTEAMPYTEELGLLCEEYHAESPDTAQDPRRRIHRDPRPVRFRERGA